MNTRSDISDIPIGVSFGWKNSYNDTDCSDSMTTLVADGLTVKDSMLAVLSNFVQPYYDVSTFMISASNTAVACTATSQLAQLSIRTTTNSGVGDLLYTLMNYPAEGFFKAADSELVDNQIWNAVFALEQGAVYRRSMTCMNAGFAVG